MEKIRIKYFTDKIEKLTYIDGKSDWIDLRASEEVEMKAGQWSCQRDMKHTLCQEVLLIRISELFRQTAAES